MSTILIAGGSGLVGSELTKFLTNAGYEVHILSRRPTEIASNIFHWDLDEQYIDPLAFDGVTAIINLAGSSIIGGRWTKSKKKDLIDSRVLSTQLLVNAANQKSSTITHFIQASAMGYFGDSGETILTEDSPASNDFMAKLCVDWETEAQKLTHITPSILRIGLYLSKAGGVYKTIAQLAKFYLASAIGSGKQYVNYTQKNEFNQLVLELLNDGMPAGIYNAVGAKPCTLGELTKAIAINEKRKVILPNVPAFLLKLVLGEASAALINSYRITSPKLAKSRIHQYSDVNEAIADL
ncbi:MAG: hypothetical protein RLZZ337_325 [Bacteroidota bacterium]|jgi:uncharacterized protein (TIGR01777 family)